MRKIKTIIVDDEQLAINVLTDKLKYFSEIEVVGVANDGTKALELLKSKKPDLLFLDVELPDMSGIDFLERMEEQGLWCYVVMCTSYEKYMLPAFRNNAFDYLLKPVKDDELQMVIKRLIAEKANPHHLHGNSIIRQIDGSFLFYLNTVDFQLVKIQDIGVFQYNHSQRVWEAVVANQTHPIKLKRNVTNEMLVALDPQLVQVHQTYIINITCLMKVKDNICYLYPPFDKVDYVRVGRSFRKKLIERFRVL